MADIFFKSRHDNIVPFFSHLICTNSEYLEKKKKVCGAQTQGVLICVMAWGKRQLVQALSLCCLSPEGKSVICELCAVSPL